MMSRHTDTEHDKDCFKFHHEHDKRISVLEVEVRLNKDTINSSISEIVNRQQAHEDKFEKMLEQLTEALVGLRLDVAQYMSNQKGCSTTWDKVWKYGIPIVIAICGGVWALYIR